MVVNMAIASSHVLFTENEQKRLDSQAQKYPVILGFYYSFSLVPVQLETCSITREGSK